jgi:Xaa-Pro aminopeptidase
MTDRFAERRERLSKIVGDDGIAVIPASVEQIRNDDVTHDFRQDSHFFYLTGFPEPDAVAVVAPGHEDGAYTLFVRPRDPVKEAWNGYRAGIDGAKERYGADTAYEIGQLDEVLSRYMVGREVLWYAVGNAGQDSRMSGLVSKARAHRDRHGVVLPSTIKDISVPLGEMRLIKTADEQAALQAASDLSASGHMEAMRFAAPGMYEYQVQAALEYSWRAKGARHNGYSSIVASGANACVLHYVENDSQIDDGDLILIDAAAEVDGYSADITRTFPANGHFTGPQRALYEVVLAARHRGLELSEPGSSMRAIHDEAIKILTEGMVELELLPRSVEDSLAMHHYLEFYFHGTGHWLGMDVHDRGVYRSSGEPRPLEPGMCFTVEPGLYVSPEKADIELALLEYDVDKRARRRIELGAAAAAAKESEEKEAAKKVKHEIPEEFLGMGIRIEDDIFIKADGMVNMTAAVPVDIDDVEALCAEESVLPR